MTQQTDPGGLGADEQQAESWVATLRIGSPAEKAVARRGLAAMFEVRGMVAEAIDLLVTNARQGYRDVELFQALSRLYRAQGDEYLAASAALEATRLSGRRPRVDGGTADRAPGNDQARDERHGWSQAPWGQASGPQAPLHGSASATAAPDHLMSDVPSSWRRPVRIAGWLTVVGTLFAGLGVTSSSL